MEGARTLRLTPPVEQVWPALSRCFEVSPGETTGYTLTAEDANGHSDSKTAKLAVGPARAAAKTGAGGARLIKEVTVSKLQVARGEQVTICYTANNATSVRITPGQAGGTQSATRGCITAKPAADTTYQVMATGAGGETDSERVTVRVR